MKVGSIVECINNSTIPTLAIQIGYKIPKLATAYTIRDFYTYPKGLGIYLEEIINPRVYTTIGIHEIAYSIKNFRELQLPDDIQEIIKQELQLK